MNIKVSVIIPVYNCECYLEKTLSSLVRQYLKDIEIICINDASTDNSQDILQAYAARDRRIRIFLLDNNSGPSVARNYGLEQAQGAYIGFVDADDYVNEEFFSSLYESSDDEYFDIIKGADLTVIKEDKINVLTINDSIRENKYNFVYQFMTAIYRSSIAKNIRFLNDMIMAEDKLFLLQAVHKCNSISIDERAKYFYVRHSDSLDSGEYTEKKVFSFIKYVENALKLVTQESINHNTCKLILNNLFAEVENIRNFRTTNQKLIKVLMALNMRIVRTIMNYR